MSNRNGDTMTQQQQISVREPRAITRLVYGTAIRAAVTQGEQAEIAAALQWYETKWQVQDAQQQGALQTPAGEPPRKVSAVEQHGMDSPEAAAMREARRQARIAAAKAAEEMGAAGGGEGAESDGDSAATRKGTR